MSIIWRLPESPRWLLRAGRDAQARQNLEAIEAEVSAEHGSLPAVRDIPPLGERRARLTELFQGQLRKRTLMLWALWIFQTLGFYGFVAWVPTLLQAHGLSLTTSLDYAALTTLGAVPGALFAWPFSDRFGRRNAIVVTSVVIAMCGLIYGLTFNPVLIVVFGFLVNFFIQTFAALAYAYTPEPYPTDIRNTGTGLAYGVGRLANIAGPLIVAALFAAAGYGSVFVYIAATWVLIAVIVAVFGERTERLSLERINAVRPGDPALPAA